MSIKCKIKQKDLKNGYYYRIVVSHCDLQYLLNSFDALYYMSGVYGWNCDVYHVFNNTCIVTGYRPSGNIRANYETVQKYNSLAERLSDYKLREKHNYNFKRFQKVKRYLLERFCRQAIREQKRGVNK